MGPGVKVTCGSRAIVRSQMIGPARLSGERQASLNESSEQKLANRPRREAKLPKASGLPQAVAIGLLAAYDYPFDPCTRFRASSNSSIRRSTSTGCVTSSRSRLFATR